MESTITGKSQDNLEEKLALYKKLASRRDEMLERLDKVESAKESVNPRIFEKVKAEYVAKLENVRSELAPIVLFLDELKRESERELADLDTQIPLIKDELAEGEFRHQVGEFSDHNLDDIRTRLEPDLEQKTARWEELTGMLEAIRSATARTGGNDTRGLDDPEVEELEDEKVDGTRGRKVVGTEELGAIAEKDNAPAEFAAESDAEETNEEDTLEALTDNPAEKSPSAARIDASPPEAESEPEPEESSFENPQSWINEFGDEKKQAKAKNSPPVEDAEADDPLSALADPSDEQRESAETADTANTKTSKKENSDEVCIGFPNLVIVTGASSGKKIPLLPMTMSVGREHDNNIELKDPEVARYHARILYERGRFVMEDLESSNGTWVNGEEVKQTTLKNGDRIRVGETEMVIDFD